MNTTAAQQPSQIRNGPPSLHSNVGWNGNAPGGYPAPNSYNTVPVSAANGTVVTNAGNGSVPPQVATSVSTVPVSVGHPTNTSNGNCFLYGQLSLPSNGETAYNSMPPKSPSGSNLHHAAQHYSTSAPASAGPSLVPIKSPSLNGNNSKSPVNNTTSHNNNGHPMLNSSNPMRPASNPNILSANGNSKPPTPSGLLNSSQNGKLNESQNGLLNSAGQKQQHTSLNPLQQLGQMTTDTSFTGYGHTATTTTTLGSQPPTTTLANALLSNTPSHATTTTLSSIPSAGCASGPVVTLQNGMPHNNNQQNGYYPGSPATGSYLISQPNGSFTYYATTDSKSLNGVVSSGDVSCNGLTAATNSSLSRLNNGSSSAGDSGRMNGTQDLQSRSSVKTPTYLTDQLNIEQDSQTSNIGTLLMDMNSSSPSASSSLAVASLATYASIGVDEQFDGSSLGAGSSSLPPVSTFILPNFRDTNYWWENNEMKTPAPGYATPITSSDATTIGSAETSPSGNGGAHTPGIGFYGAEFVPSAPNGYQYQYSGAYHTEAGDYSSFTSLTSTLSN